MDASSRQCTPRYATLITLTSSSHGLQSHGIEALHNMCETTALSPRLMCSFCRTIACCTDRTQERDRQAKAAARGKMLEYAKKAQNEVQQGIQSSPGKSAKPSKYIASSRESSLSSGVAGTQQAHKGPAKEAGLWA